MLVPMGSKLGHTGLLGRPRLRLGTCAGPTGLQLAPHLDGLPPPDQLKLPVHAPVPLEALLQHLGGQGGAGPAQRGGVWQHVGAWVQIMVRACAWGGTEALASCHSGPRHSLVYVPMCIRAHIQRVRMAAHQLACCMPQAEPRCSVLAVPMQCSSERTHGTHATRALACMRRVRACVHACMAPLHSRTGMPPGACRWTRAPPWQRGSPCPAATLGPGAARGQTAAARARRACAAACPAGPGHRCPASGTAGC